MDKRVSLFVTCMVDQLFPKVGMAMADVIERLGYQVDFSEDQTCCGQPA
jgi:L-lactate dehydrogenase complex protein LldE